MKIHHQICLTVYILTLLLNSSGIDSELIINVKNQGGDILQETISANVTEDVNTLEFLTSDGTLITHLVDFKNDLQVFRSLILGEEERGQSQYQVVCFVTRFQRSEFISSDAISKLRQKNPGTIRIPEEDKGTEVFSMDVLLDLNKSSALSPHVKLMCLEAKNTTYARESDLKYWESLKSTSDMTVNSSGLFSSLLDFLKVPRCMERAELNGACICPFEISVPWYPCALKYCRGKDSEGKLVSYRCGIKTCRKTRHFDYYVQEKQQCLWDE